MPDMCMPEMNGDCWEHCPAACHPDDIVCTGGIDGNGEKRDLHGLQWCQLQ